MCWRGNCNHSCRLEQPWGGMVLCSLQQCHIYFVSCPHCCVSKERNAALCCFSSLDTSNFWRTGPLYLLYWIMCLQLHTCSHHFWENHWLKPQEFQDLLSLTLCNSSLSAGSMSAFTFSLCSISCIMAQSCFECPNEWCVYHLCPSSQCFAWERRWQWGAEIAECNF